MKKIQNTNKTKEKLNKATKHLRVAKYALMTILIIMSFATPVLADDPLSAINGLSGNRNDFVRFRYRTNRSVVEITRRFTTC